MSQKQCLSTNTYSHNYQKSAHVSHLVKSFAIHNKIRCFRYIMSEQKKAEEFGITEDDVSEIRQDINKFRFELVDILRKNNFDIGKVRNEGCYGGRRAKQMERRIMKVI